MPEIVQEYAKFIAAIIGTAATTALGVIPEGGTLWVTLTIISAVATAVAVAVIPNKPKPTQLPA